jgi:hypothetical protein
MLNKFQGGFSSVELFLFLVITLVCFFIYFKTREVYELTSHKGIGYFRKGFVFFGLSSLIMVIVPILGPGYFDLRFLFKFIIIFQLVGVLYLLFSLFYKKLRSEWMIYVFTFLVLFSSLFFRSKFFLGLLVFMIFLVVGVTSVYNYIYIKKSNKISLNIYLIYSLLFFLWVFRFFYFIFDLDFYFGKEFIGILMAVTFGYIGYIVNKKLTLRSED